MCERKSFSTSLEKDLLRNFKIYCAKADKLINETLEEAMKLYLQKQDKDNNSSEYVKECSENSHQNDKGYIKFGELENKSICNDELLRNMKNLSECIANSSNTNQKFQGLKPNISNDLQNNTGYIERTQIKSEALDEHQTVEEAEECDNDEYEEMSDDEAFEALLLWSKFSKGE